MLQISFFMCFVAFFVFFSNKKRIIFMSSQLKFVYEQTCSIVKIGSSTNGLKVASSGGHADVSATSGSSAKKLWTSMKWQIVAVLAIVLIAMVVASIIIVVLNNSKRVNEFNENADATNTDMKGLLRHYDNDVGLKTTKGLPADTSFEKYTTSSTTVMSVTDVPIEKSESNTCDFDTTSSSCSRPKQTTRRRIIEEVGSNNASDIFSVAKPTDYILNISVTDRNERRLRGKIIIWVEILRDTNKLLLKLSPSMQIMEEHLMSVSLCVDGTASLICIESITRFVDDGHILLTLSRSVSAGAVLRIGVEHFETALTSASGGLLLRQPKKWERHRAWIVGTLNTAGAQTAASSLSSNVFPLVVSSVEHKSTFKLCLEHPKDAVARSNMPKKSTIDLSSHLAATCFQSTPKIAFDSFAFVIFDNLQLISDLNASEPNVEAYVGKHLAAENIMWIIDETHQILNKMAEITQVKYPLSKLTLLSSPLSPFDDGAAALGLAHIKETWVEHPKYVFTHNVLIAQLVRQWMANIVTFCDKCFQDGVVTYLEWRLRAQLESKIAAVDELSTNMTRRFIEARNRLLQNGSSTSAPFTGSLKPPNDCADRIAVILFMLENAYSFSVIKNFISVTVREQAWTECISNSRLSEIFGRVTNGSKIARRVFETFVGNDSSAPPPLIRIKVNNGIMTVSQDKNDNEGNISMTAIPIQITDDSQHQTQLILSTADVMSERPTKFVIAEPTSYVRHIYNPENYDNILNCYGRNCPALSYDAVTNALNDLCWALLSNKIEADKSSQSAWMQIFNNLSKHPRDLIQDANCRCCMKGRANEKTQCRWTWRDTCSKISILNT